MVFICSKVYNYSPPLKLPGIQLVMMVVVMRFVVGMVVVVFVVKLLVVVWLDCCLLTCMSPFVNSSS